MLQEIKQSYKQAFIEARVKEMAEFAIDTGKTTREIAKHFGFSKSTVHLDLRYRLPKISMDLYSKVIPILEKNLEERSIRGGESMRKKAAKEDK